jgi:hypothetical protein
MIQCVWFVLFQEGWKTFLDNSRTGVLYFTVNDAKICITMHVSKLAYLELHVNSLTRLK